jgi:hypothetical protein
MNEPIRLALVPAQFRQHLGKELDEFRTILFFACTVFFQVLFGCAARAIGRGLLIYIRAHDRDSGRSNSESRHFCFAQSRLHI